MFKRDLSPEKNQNAKKIRYEDEQSAPSSSTSLIEFSTKSGALVAKEKTQVCSQMLTY